MLGNPGAEGRHKRGTGECGVGKRRETKHPGSRLEGRSQSKPPNRKKAEGHTLRGVKANTASESDRAECMVW